MCIRDRYQRRVHGKLRLIIMTLALSLYVLAGALLYPFLLKAHWAQEEVLSYFLRIPPEALTQLQDKCESYLAKKHSKKQTERCLEENSKANAEGSAEEDPANKPKATKKVFLKTSSMEWTLFYYILALVVVLSIQCIGATLFVTYIGNIIGNSIELIYANSYLDPLPLLILVSIQDLIIIHDKTLQTTLQADDIDGIMDIIYKMRESSERILKVNLKKDGWYKGRHINYFNNWIYASMCDGWQDFDCFSTKEECEEFLEGIAMQGYYNVLMEYGFLAPTIITIGEIRNSSQNLNSEDWAAMRKTARYIVHNKNSYYIDYLISMIADITNEAKAIVLSVALVYMIVTALGFVILWIPYTLTLRKEICRTNAMLMLIPVEVYLSNRHLRESFGRRVSALTMSK
eukprot:TRINITY_DN7807_c0_g5_i1.p1 TRINITY_DN7807_c0_g5~~TRINITY_DN7807_c0_g5_i1.p1  ORF type:complete len:402 (-),score=126.88 TRINITY_DN7807_c0_g5_i1:88-1293(-)